MNKTTRKKASDQFDFTELNSMLPPGFHIVKKGGRPRKDDRDRAVYMAMLWRTNLFNESSAAATDWMLDVYLAQCDGKKVIDLSGKGKNELNMLWRAFGKGITEAAHVRRYKAKGLSLMDGFVMLCQPFGVIAWEAATPGTNEGIFVREGGVQWFWFPAFPVAIQGEITNVQVQVQTDEMLKTPIAMAVLSAIS